MEGERAMKTLKHAVARFVREEEGVTAIEYGLIAGLIAVVIIGTVTTVGTDLKKVFTSIITGLKAVP
jgi:pilus assembly protein Flp/PilA